MTTAQTLVLTPALACVLAFSWGTLRHFQRSGPMPLGMRLIGAISLVTIVAFVWSVLSSPMPDTWPAAVVLSMGSLALFTWSVNATFNSDFALAFAKAQPSRLMVSGPFRYVRHPFYTSYLIFWLANFVATLSSMCALGSLVLLVCYVSVAREEERSISRSRLAAEYANYASDTGMFLPKRRRRQRWALDPEVYTSHERRTE